MITEKYVTENTIKAFLKRREQLKAATRVGNKDLDKYSNLYDDIIDNELNVFIADALLLKNIEFDKQKRCRAIKSKGNAIQYYMFKEDELFEYFAFRTAVRHDVLPLNRQNSDFVTLYLMEVLNGVYGEEFNHKFELVNRLVPLIRKGLDNKELVVEAFEKLYVQHSEELTLSEYSKMVPLTIFEGTSLTNKDGKFLPVEEILKVTIIEEVRPVSEIEMVLLTDCFEFVFNQVRKDSCYEIVDSLQNTLFTKISSTSKEYETNKLNALNPLLSEVEYYRADGTFVKFENGEQSLYKVDLEKIDTEILLFFINFIICSIKHQCEGKRLRFKSIVCCFWEFYKDELVNALASVDEAVGQWVALNPQAKVCDFTKIPDDGFGNFDEYDDCCSDDYDEDYDDEFDDDDDDDDDDYF